MIHWQTTDSVPRYSTILAIKDAYATGLIGSAFSCADNHTKLIRKSKIVPERWWNGYMDYGMVSADSSCKAICTNNIIEIL